jgi:hypothetical protein
LLETTRGRPSHDAPLVAPKRPPTAPLDGPPPRASEPNIARAGSQPSVSGEIGRSDLSGEIRRHPSTPPVRHASQPNELAAASGEIHRPRTPSDPVPRQAGTIEVPRSPDEITQPNLRTPVPGSVRIPIPPPPPPSDEPRGAIIGIGMGHIGSGSVAGEIPSKVAPGARVLVPGPNGLMQSATVRQLLSGYYELEVGSSGETIWVPVSGVVPE